MSVWTAGLLFLGFVAITAHMRYRACAQAGPRLLWIISFSLLAGATLLYIVTSFYLVASVK
ncbi:MAG: hypothetical protein GX181_05410 [Synergistaceae bacterium]|nr:hypothetical protein [Synergistota bacterium]NLM71378.1 hypothetical protein [Synergistaceae bacterium]